jgi:RNA polymerase sigma-70 factor, ECF subfamily
MSGDDDVTVERAKRGDREAFAALVRKYQRRVYTTAFHLTGNHGDADDVAQATFLRAFAELAELDGQAELFPWLRRIVVKLACATASTGPRGERVLDALAQLTPALRVTLVLAAVEGLAYREIAELLACSSSSVYWRLNQARKQMRHMLADVPSAEELDTDELLRRTTDAAAAS